MHSLLGLYCTKNHKWVLSDIAFVWRRIGFIILLFYLFFIVIFFCRVFQFWLLFLCILIIN